MLRKCPHHGLPDRLIIQTFYNGLRDSDGRLIFAFYKEFGEKGVLEAEALAVLEGLRVCAAKGVQEVMVEVDFAVLVSLVKS